MSDSTWGGLPELLDTAAQPTDSESPDAPYSADVWELRSRINALSDALRARLGVGDPELEPTDDDISSARLTLRAAGKPTDVSGVHTRLAGAYRSDLDALRRAVRSGYLGEVAKVVREMTAVERVGEEMASEVMATSRLRRGAR